MSRARYNALEFLSAPNANYQFVWKSSIPREVTTVDTIIKPFDQLTWVFFMVSWIMVALVLLATDIVVQRKGASLKTNADNLYSLFFDQEN